MLLIAAGTGAFVGEVEPPDRVAIVAVVAFAAALVTEIFLLTKRPERAWYEGRAAAESVKTLGWRFSVGGKPFGVRLPQEEARNLFIQQLHDILQDLRDITLDPGPEGGEQITERMLDLRRQSQFERKATYEQFRVDDQQRWYRSKATWNAKRASLWLIGALVLEVVGITAGILTITGAVRIDVLGVIAAAVAGVAAWLQTKQHETLSRAYGVAAQELASVRTLLGAEHDEDEWAEFVDEAEEAISREHTLWRASRGVIAQ